MALEPNKWSSFSSEHPARSSMSVVQLSQNPLCTQNPSMKNMIERTLGLPMKSMILGAMLLAAFTLTAQDSLPQNTPEVRVPDAATALKIAEPALIKKYGKRQIDYERPLTAKLDSGVWTVYGTLCCPDRNGHRTCEEGKCVGGVAVLKLRQSDGKILSVIHYK